MSVTPSFCMRTRQWNTMHSREFLTHCIISKWLAVRLTWGFDPKKVVFRIIEKVVFIRSRIMNMPYGDQVIFIKRKFFHQIGCFREIPIMEDVDLIRRKKISGGKITIISSKVQTVPRRWEREGILYCTVRIGCWFLYFSSVFRRPCLPDFTKKHRRCLQAGLKQNRYCECHHKMHIYSFVSTLLPYHSPSIPIAAFIS